MRISAKRMAVLHEHIRAESAHDIDALIGGMTADCFNDVVGAPEPFLGPAQTAERYRRHWAGFPDFTVQVRRILCADESCVVTENEWRGTHLGTFMGFRSATDRGYCGLAGMAWSDQDASGELTAMAIGASQWASIIQIGEFSSESSPAELPQTVFGRHFKSPTRMSCGQAPRP